MKKEIKEIYIYEPGDWSVGIPDLGLTLADERGDYIVDLSVFADEDIPEIVEKFRKDLAWAFEGVIGENLQISFDCD